MGARLFLDNPFVNEYTSNACKEHESFSRKIIANGDNNVVELFLFPAPFPPSQGNFNDENHFRVQ